MIVAERKNHGTQSGLLHTRYSQLASNTIDYWMLPDDQKMSESRIAEAIKNAKVFPNSTLQIYLHVPFCAQRCRFCAFSGGNDLDFKQAERYSRLVVAQLQQMHANCAMKGHPVRSVNIGGGSPDLVGSHIGYILKAVRDLPGVTDRTEVSVEFTLSTVSREFIDQLAEFNVTKASFGVQSLDSNVRRYMRQPKTLHHLERVLDWIDGRVPVVNADLITGMPGQTLSIVFRDLEALMSDRRINAISSYLLTPGAAPSLLAALNNETIPPMPDASVQALMRLHTYSTFLRQGWTRRGTNTYVDPSRIDPGVVAMIAGNECIGTGYYEDYLLGVGPQAVSHIPGARLENHVNIRAWTKAIEGGGNPYYLPKCSDVPQRDTGLWVFPLRWEGLDGERLESMVASGAIADGQLNLFREFEQEGLISRTSSGYRVSILGEVFMGRLVRDLKQGAGQQAVDDYIAEGFALAESISQGKLSDNNEANNRQLFESERSQG